VAARGTIAFPGGEAVVARLLLGGGAVSSGLIRKALQCVRSLLVLWIASMPLGKVKAEVPHSIADLDYERSIDDGIAAFGQHRYTAARKLFARAHAIRPSARTLRALGATDFALDDYTIAKRELEQALVHEVNPLSEDQRREALGILSWMKDNLATVVLQVAPAGARATIDGAAVDPGDVLLVPGSHQLEVSADGFRTHQQSFALERAGMRKILQVALRSSSETAARADSTEWLWIGGSGLVLVAGGGALLAAGLHERSELSDPGPPYQSSSSGEAQLDRSRWFTGAGIGLGVLGIAGMTTALILKLADGEAASDAHALRVDASLTQVSIRGRFE